MILTISIDDQLNIGRDLYDMEKYIVKIELHCSSQRAVLQKDQNGAQLSAKAFLEYVEHCKKLGNPLFIDWEMGETPKAWICDRQCNGNAKNTKCEINTSEDAVLIRVVG